MKGSRSYYLSILLMIKISTIPAQKAPSLEYVVITYEKVFNKGFEGPLRTFWIIPVDSIVSFNSKIYPLFLNISAKIDFDSCEVGSPIDPMNNGGKENVVLISGTQLEELKSFYYLIYKRRKLIQQITKKWSSGNWTKTTIYATCVRGAFCNCHLSTSEKLRSGYIDKVFLPISTIKDFEQFWQSAESRFIINRDFENYNYSNNLLFNKLPRGDIYGKASK